MTTRLAPGERIRVLHVVPWVLMGGVERRRLTLARLLGDEFEQQVVCFSGRGPLFDAFAQTSTRVTPLGESRGRELGEHRAHVRLHRLVRRWRPHVVHSAIFPEMIWGLTAGLLHRSPVVLLEETSSPFERTGRSHRRSAKSRFVLRGLVALSSGIVAVAPAVRRSLIDDHGIPPRKVFLVPNGVAEFELVAREEALAERRRLGIPDEAFVVGLVGRIHDDVKRVSDLLEAVCVVRARGHDVRALVVGDGGDLPALKDRARRLGLEDAAVFTGRREDRELFFAMMDAFVLCSATEAAPLALMEAMLCGLPVVATRVGGVADFTEDEETALLVPRLRPDRLAEAIARLVEDSELRERLGRNARVVGRERFGGRRYAHDVRELYLERLRNAGVL